MLKKIGTDLEVKPADPQPDTGGNFGDKNDLPVPGDYAGNGTAGAVIIRPASGFWAVRGVSRAYFGTAGDIPVAR